MNKKGVYTKQLDSFFKEEEVKVKRYLRQSFNLTEDDIDDVFQESAIAMFGNMNTGKLVNLRCSLSTYFLRICINQSLKAIRQKQKTVPLVNIDSVCSAGKYSDTKIDELIDLCVSNKDEAYLSQREQVVNEIISCLPEKCHNIFWGYYWNNFSLRTIALEFGYTNAETVKTDKYRCINKFRKRYKELMQKKYGKD